MGQPPLHAMLVFGTRPEAIKMAPLAVALSRSDAVRHTVCVTAQHRQMLDQVLDLFGILPEVDLDLMTENQTLAGLTSRALTGLDAVFAQHRPDVVLVHGDTTTTMSAGLAAFYHRIPVAHVEAGLRTHDKWAPWPEEINRQITGRIADYHYAPTAGARDNLVAEGVDEARILVTGNTVIDALYWVSRRLDEALQAGDTNLDDLLAQNATSARIRQDDVRQIADAVAGKRRLVLITGHRRENFGDGFASICRALVASAQEHPDDLFVYPVHLNPRVDGPVRRQLGEAPNIVLLPPLDYLGFVYLLKSCYIVVTDSGGIQEEAPGLGKPVLVMRDTTERPEAVDAGTVRLVGADEQLIRREIGRLMSDEGHYNAMARAENPYGDGRACERIVQHLEERVPRRAETPARTTGR